jgi:hypothetical protein
MLTKPIADLGLEHGVIFPGVIWLKVLFLLDTFSLGLISHSFAPSVQKPQTEQWKV